jgi:hypothetical protein
MRIKSSLGNDSHLRKLKRALIIMNTNQSSNESPYAECAHEILNENGIQKVRTRRTGCLTYYLTTTLFTDYGMEPLMNGDKRKMLSSTNWNLGMLIKWKKNENNS